MDFPSYVPNAVRELIASMIEDDLTGCGWRDLQRKTETDLHRLEGLMQTAVNSDDLHNLRIEMADVRASAQDIGERIACLERIALRPEMQAAYARLVGTLCTDGEFRTFICAASGADMDYSHSRDRLREAAEIARKVADAAGTLHDLLRKAERFSPNLPTEFFSVERLLRNSNFESDDVRRFVWPRMRHLVLGGLPDPLPQEDLPVGALVSAIDALPLASEEQSRMMVHAWSTAPGMRHIVATMQRAAQACIPTETWAIGAAISSRKRNRKTEYLRAFAYLLRKDPRLALTVDIMNAMAVTATVVLNDPETVVTYDDVRKAVKGGAGVVLED